MEDSSKGSRIVGGQESDPNKHPWQVATCLELSSLIFQVFECDGVLGDIAHKGRSCQPAHLVRRLTLISIFNKLSPIFQYDLEHGPSTEKDHNSAIAAPHRWMGTGKRCNVWRTARF